MKRLIVLRHGDYGSVHLTDFGQKQMQHTADQLIRFFMDGRGNEDFGWRIYTSPLPRAQESAQIIADRFFLATGKTSSIDICVELNEAGQGILSHDDIKLMKDVSIFVTHQPVVEALNWSLLGHGQFERVGTASGFWACAESWEDLFKLQFIRDSGPVAPDTLIGGMTADPAAFPASPSDDVPADPEWLFEDWAECQDYLIENPPADYYRDPEVEVIEFPAESDEGQGNLEDLLMQVSHLQQAFVRLQGDVRGMGDNLSQQMADMSSGLSEALASQFSAVIQASYNWERGPSPRGGAMEGGEEGVSIRIPAGKTVQLKVEP